VTANSAVIVPVRPAAEQVTSIGQVPGAVVLPTVHVQVETPFVSADFVVRPFACDWTVE
jgi:hypothetical protein